VLVVAAVVVQPMLAITLLVVLVVLVAVELEQIMTRHQPQQRQILVAVVLAVDM
jgi:hypothetical protein